MRTLTICLMTSAVFSCLLVGSAKSEDLTGGGKIWQPVTLTIDGPDTSETADDNPFRNYRLIVTFSSGGSSYSVPGYYAADGNAGETSGEKGNKWRAHFVPDRVGRWKYRVSFRKGTDLALSVDEPAGDAVKPDGLTGEFDVAPLAASDSGPWTRGKLAYVGKRYTQYLGDKSYYLKGGADSPENFLAYVDFDGTEINPNSKKKANKKGAGLHEFKPHLKDFHPGDPTWKDGKGKAMIGALNYLSSKGMNSVYFLTMNVTGDGDDVWPWVAADVRDRFDCSKLDQWNVVFNHMDRLGIVLHVITQETENDQLLDKGELGPLRKLYYRELIARFAHHQGVVWNLGEENTNTTVQQKQFCDYIEQLDPYANLVVAHTFPGEKNKVYAPLLGYKTFDGLSLQFSDDWETIPRVTADWVARSEKAGRPWVVNIDEPGTAKFGVDHDAKTDGNNQRTARKTALWGALLAGGGGVEWYFGYANPHNDLNCEDWRSRDRLWDQTRYALEFFQQHLPFEQMHSANELIKAGEGYCMAKTGDTYALYMPHGNGVMLDLTGAKGSFKMSWYNPRTGGKLIAGAHAGINTGLVSTGPAPRKPNQDWVLLLKHAGDRNESWVDPPKPETAKPQNDSAAASGAVESRPLKLFVEKNGLVAGEAEDYVRQAKFDVRRWHTIQNASGPQIEPDPDPSHFQSASGEAYLEILPDTRRTHADRLQTGVNFSNEPGKMAILDYQVRFKNPGRYYVWVRAYSTGGEDNGLHVGLDGAWPASGQRLQWCKGKNSWWWESRQRTNAEHCGEPYKIFLDVKEAGLHTVSFSMREDGFEFDKWILTTDRDFARPEGAGPVSTAVEN